MPDHRTVASWTFHVLAEVETGHRWDDCSYDPIGDGMSCGIVQEYAYNIRPLAELINERCPDEWNKMPEPIRSQALSRPDDEWPGWRWPEEAFKAMQEILNSECGRQCQIMRFCQLYNNEYLPRLQKQFYFRDDKALIFAVTIYHQSPASAITCCAVAKDDYGTITLNSIYQAARYNSVVGNYTDRQNTVYNMLKEWDGESMPPDGCDVGSCEGDGYTQSGGSGGYEGGATGHYTGENQGMTDRSGNVVHLQQFGNNLYSMGSNKATFTKIHGQMWVGTGGWVSSGFGGSDGNPSSNGINSSSGAFTGNSNSNCAAVEFSCQEGILEAFDYVYGGPRTLQGCIAAGGTDCSGWACIAFREARNVYIGDSTNDQVASDTQETIWEGTSWDDVPWDNMKCGDLIYMKRAGGTMFLGGGEEHVAIYTGATPGEVIDAGRSPLPRIRDITAWGTPGYIVVRRVWEVTGEANDAGDAVQNLCLDSYAPDFESGYPNSLTIHSTGEVDISAQQWATSYCNRSTDNRVHYFCDDKECIQILSETKKGKHAFEPANSWSLSLEICEFSNYDRAMESINNSAKHAANIMKRHGWSVDSDMFTHKYWTDNYQGDHTDPDDYFARINFSWELFKTKVRGYM